MKTTSIFLAAGLEVLVTLLAPSAALARTPKGSIKEFPISGPAAASKTSDSPCTGTSCGQVTYPISVGPTNMAETVHDKVCALGQIGPGTAEVRGYCAPASINGEKYFGVDGVVRGSACIVTLSPKQTLANPSSKQLVSLTAKDGDKTLCANVIYIGSEAEALAINQDAKAADKQVRDLGLLFALYRPEEPGFAGPSLSTTARLPDGTVLSEKPVGIVASVYAVDTSCDGVWDLYWGPIKGKGQTTLSAAKQVHNTLDTATISGLYADANADLTNLGKLVHRDAISATPPR